MARYTNVAAIKTFQKNVATSGTPVQLTYFPVPDGAEVVVKAKSTNTGTITVGGSSDEALSSGTSYFGLAPNEAVKLQVKHTDNIWIDATVSNDGVQVIFEF